jgi:murein DD-endopeptidase MepM/ murein hydrolase activator NlpD
MKQGVGGITRALAILYLIAVHLTLVYLVGERLSGKYVTFAPMESVRVDTPGGERVLTPEMTETVPSPTVMSEPAVPSTTGTPAPAESFGGRTILIPVQGIRTSQLTDTFAAARAAGRSHDAIDIMAPAGAPVLAAVDGQIIKFFDSVPGGITIYEASTDRQYMYYYAHLQRRADDIHEADTVKQGRTIGYVGDTGNAGPGNYHLHFSVARVADPKRYWEGTYIDPYPYLMIGRAPE